MLLGQPAHCDYEVTGVAVEGLVGLEYHSYPGFSLFGDYKLSYSNNDASLKDGGSLQTDIVTNHFIFGASYRFGGGPGLRPTLPIKGLGRCTNPEAMTIWAMCRCGRQISRPALSPPNLL